MQGHNVLTSRLVTDLSCCIAAMVISGNIRRSLKTLLIRMGITEREIEKRLREDRERVENEIAE